MRPPLPTPIAIPWTMKPLASAQTRLEHLDDGRLRLSIVHDVLHGVTPSMLVWWFTHLEGVMEFEGAHHERYRIWHPHDHVSLRYAKRSGAGIGPGSVFHITEYLGRNPDHLVDVHTRVERLDEGGFRHRPRVAGLSPVVMDYRFTRVPGGTLYENSLVLGFAHRAARPLNERLRRRFIPDAKGHAWLLHNVEEVGNLEFFLPRLIEAESGRGPTRVALPG